MRKKSEEIKISTLLGKGSELGGNFTAPESARIDGKVNGDVTVKGTLVVGSTGAITGNVVADTVLIGGEIFGNISAPEKAELTATARVFGDIATKVIVIDEHAIFQGKIDMNQEMPEKKNRKAPAKTVRAGKKSAKAAIAEALREVAEKEEQENGTSTVAQVKEEVTNTNENPAENME